MRNFLLFIISIGLFYAVYVLFQHDYSRIQRQNEAFKHFQSVNAVVVGTSVRKESLGRNFSYNTYWNEPEEHAFVPVVTYTYEWKGHRCQSSRYSYRSEKQPAFAKTSSYEYFMYKQKDILDNSPSKKARHQDALRSLKERYPVGKDIKAYANPVNPCQAVLDKSKFNATIRNYGIYIILFGLCFVCLFCSIFRKIPEGTKVNW